LSILLLKFGFQSSAEFSILLDSWGLLLSPLAFEHTTKNYSSEILTAFTDASNFLFFNQHPNRLDLEDRYKIEASASLLMDMQTTIEKD
jgi:hypothetical protein